MILGEKVGETALRAIGLTLNGKAKLKPRAGAGRHSKKRSLWLSILLYCFQIDLEDWPIVPSLDVTPPGIELVHRSGSLWKTRGADLVRLRKILVDPRLRQGLAL